MADNYIDYLECREYGNHLLNEGKSLLGASPLVDIVALLAYIQTHVNAVSAELSKQGIEQSGTRIDRIDVEAKGEALRTQLRKFHSYLDALDESIAFDVGAFFNKGLLGNLNALKPADAVEKAAEVLRGFEADGNASLPNKDSWKLKLENAQSALAGAMAGKMSHAGETARATKDLSAARQGFLKAYNKVAKPMIRSLLVSLDREAELPLFFKDLAVNEQGGAKKTDAPPTGGEGAPQTS